MVGVDWVPAGWPVRIGQSLGVARRKRHEALCRHEYRGFAGLLQVQSVAAVVRFDLIRTLVKALCRGGLFPASSCRA